MKNNIGWIEAAHGEAALDYLKQEYPDLILSDVMMPGIQGDELCQLVKENLDTAGIPFILLTAKTNHDAMVAGLSKGADDYISKPFTTEILQLKVQGLLENRRREKLVDEVRVGTRVERVLYSFSRVKKRIWKTFRKKSFRI